MGWSHVATLRVVLPLPRYLARELNRTELSNGMIVMLDERVGGSGMASARCGVVLWEACHADYKGHGSEGMWSPIEFPPKHVREELLGSAKLTVLRALLGGDIDTIKSWLGDASPPPHCVRIPRPHGVRCVASYFGPGAAPPPPPPTTASPPRPRKRRAEATATSCQSCARLSTSRYTYNQHAVPFACNDSDDDDSHTGPVFPEDDEDMCAIRDAEVGDLELLLGYDIA